MSDKAVINFAAGPAKLPEEVMKKAQHEMVDYKGHGHSVMEMSHRSAEFSEILETARNKLRSLLKIPLNYDVLFLQGGGSGQFSALPLNLMNRGDGADYIVTGAWSNKAKEEAKRYGKVHVVAKPDKFNHIPSPITWTFSPNPSYIYYCDNETVHGVEFHLPPDVPFDTEKVPIVADMSSNLLTKELDVSKYGVIFASAQKNIGCAGITVVIIRHDLMGYAMPVCPSILNYQIQSDNRSVYNTPPCYSLYIMGLVYEWLEERGGVSAFAEKNRLKSQMLYSTIENSNGFYHSVVDRDYRSRVNVPFRVGSINGDLELEAAFLKEAYEEARMKELKGHRSVGGIRASLYNAISIDEVRTLCDFMVKFQKKYAR